MECNRDEAIRAKVIAEKKFEAQDIKGARRFALKAKSLFPGLEGIQQILSTIDVYIAAETKINGETDWYGILGVDPAAVEVTVRKHYRKLALLLHPDKNKCIGAEGAFKLISESWSVLSDKARRSAFDQKMKSKKTAPQPSSVPKSTSCPQWNVPKSTPCPQWNVPKSTPCPQWNVPKSTPCPQPNVPKSTSSPQTNGFRNFTKSACSNNKVHNKPSTTTNKSSKGSSSPIPPPPPSSQKEKPTFWTVCLCCRVQYEYPRVYLHHNLLCPNCRKPFFAKESANPPSDAEVLNQKKQFECQNLNNSGNHATIHQVPVSGTSGVASSSSQAATMVQQAYEQVKRKREEAEAAAKRKKTRASRKTAGDSKRRKVDKDHEGTEANKKGISELFKAYSASTTKDNKDDTVQQGLSHLKDQTNLTEEARISINKNLKDPSPDHSKIAESTEKIGITGKEPVKEMTMDVSHPHFYVFDNDRTEKCFGENEVWAVYDDDDGMPRHYAMITSVISLNPFKVKIKWLKSKIFNEHDDIWQNVVSCLRKTCGVFTLGKLEDYTLLNSFSHKVRWIEKGEEGDIHIFPEKGDVWALYKNWSPNWDELTSDEDIHAYDVVEVIKDYVDENMGVSVIPLVKVAGFKTLFHYHLDPKESFSIRKEDMSRFSHRVPSHLIKGQEEEVPSYLKGCLELDPASTPPQLQVVMAKSEEENGVENEKEAMENGTS